MPSISYNVSGRCLNVAGKSINFPSPITKVIEVKDCLVVLVKPLADTAEWTGNIYAISNSGKQLWQIQRSPRPRIPDIYIDVWLENGQLMAGSGIGFQYRVNLNDGTIVALVREVK